MSADGGGAVCACTRPGVSKRIVGRNLASALSLSAFDLGSGRIRSRSGGKEAVLADIDVEPSPETPVTGDVSFQCERRTSRTTNQTNLSRELETSTALATGRTATPHATHETGRHCTTRLCRTGRIQPLASVLQVLRAGSTLREILLNRGNFGTEDDRCVKEATRQPFPSSGRSLEANAEPP